MDIQIRSQAPNRAPAEPGQHPGTSMSPEEAAVASFAQHASSQLLPSYLAESAAVKASPLVQALVQPAGSMLFPSVFGTGLPYPHRPLVSAEPPVTTEDTHRACAVRAEALEKLKKIQSELSTCDVAPGLMPQYLSLLKTLALDLSAAKSIEQLEAVDLHLSLVHTAWERTKRNEAQRRWALGLSVLVFALIVLVLISVSGIIYLMTGAVPIITNLVVPGINVPVYVLLWSAIGSCCAVLYRVNRAADLELEDPIRLMVAQPIMSVVMGTVSYLIVRLGLLTLTGDSVGGGAATDPYGVVSSAEERAVYFLSFMAFLVGFSDRFANGLLRTLAGRFGGESNADLVTPRPASISTDAALLNATLSAIGRQGTLVRDAAGGPPADAASGDAQDGDRVNSAGTSRRVASSGSGRIRRGRPRPTPAPSPAEVLPAALLPATDAVPLPPPAVQVTTIVPDTSGGG